MSIIGVNSSVKERIKVMGWAYKLAWNMNKKMLIFLILIISVLSVLPAIALGYNREVISYISNFITTGQGEFTDVVPSIIILGSIMTLIGLSMRINGDLIYMMMYDSYYVGMQELLMDRIQKIEFTELLKSEVNDEYNFVIERGGSLTELLSNSCSIISKVISVVSLLILAYSSSQTVFIITPIYIILVLFFNFSNVDKIRSDEAKVRKVQRLASYFNKMPESLGVAKEVRIYGNKEEIVTQWKKANKVVVNNANKRSFDIELRNFISSLGFYLFFIVMMIFSIFDVLQGEIKPDVFLIIYALCLNIYYAISDLARNIMTFDHAIFALERQNKFLNNTYNQDEEREKSGSDQPLIENRIFDAKNIIFGYKKDVTVIKDLSFTIDKGEVVALVGQNGCGKTTLVKLLLNMYKPQSGDLLFYGQPYDVYKKGFIRKKIGVFFQDYYLFHHSLQENIGYGGIENLNDNKMIKEAVQKGGASKIIDRLPKGLDSLYGRVIDGSGVELSGGERQKIAVSRAHMNNRDILIFDEPASMIDPIAEMEQFLHIKHMLDGRTAILISHRVGFARLADKIIMMDDGHIVETGTHDELISKNGKYANFFHQQAQWYEENAYTGGSK